MLGECPCRLSVLQEFFIVEKQSSVLGCTVLHEFGYYCQRKHFCWSNYSKIKPSGPNNKMIEHSERQHRHEFYVLWGCTITFFIFGLDEFGTAVLCHIFFY